MISRSAPGQGSGLLATLRRLAIPPRLSLARLGIPEPEPAKTERIARRTTATLVILSGPVALLVSPLPRDVVMQSTIAGAVIGLFAADGIVAPVLGGIVVAITLWMMGETPAPFPPVHIPWAEHLIVALSAATAVRSIAMAIRSRWRRMHTARYR